MPRPQVWSTPRRRSASIQTPDQIFAAAKLAEWWNASLGYTLASGRAVSWTGQKRGITVAKGSSNGPVYNASDATFGGYPTLEGGDNIDNRALAVTGISPALLPASCSPCVIATIRRTKSGSTPAMVDMTGGGATQLLLYCAPIGTLRGLWRTDQPANKETTMAVDTTVAAICRTEHQNATNGAKLFYGASLAQSTNAFNGIQVAVNAIALFAGPFSGGGNGPFACPEIVVLSDIPSAGEWSAYQTRITQLTGIV